MSAIYELKNQIYSEISDIAYKIVTNDKDNDYFCQAEKKVNKYIDKLSSIQTQFTLNLNINAVKLDQSDIKNCFYGIVFELYLNINNSNYKNSEKIIFNVIEKILKLLSNMEFYYCYKLNNQDIKSEIIIQTNKLKETKIKINWITNLHMNNNLFN